MAEINVTLNMISQIKQFTKSEMKKSKQINVIEPFCTILFKEEFLANTHKTRVKPTSSFSITEKDPKSKQKSVLLKKNKQEELWTEDLESNVLPINWAH